MTQPLTCQICARAVMATGGLIAHHGYQRPGDGYQTESCYGARQLPFESDRATLAKWIKRLLLEIEGCAAYITNLQDERAPVMLEFHAKSGFPTFASVKRDTFDHVTSNNSHILHGRRGMTFDEAKKLAIVAQERRLASLRSELRSQTSRYDSWTQTLKMSSQLNLEDLGL